MEHHIFDIETKPYSEEDILKNSKPFSKDDVKLGNLKDPEKIEAKLDAAEDIYKRNLLDKAALDPHTSSICAIGYNERNTDSVKLLLGDERDILTEFWNVFRGTSEAWCFWSGSNDKTAFDPRHIIMRSWKLGVPTAWRVVGKRGFLTDRFVDISQTYLFGASYPSYCSADKAAEQLGLVGTQSGCGMVKSKQALKSSGVEGKNFHEVLESNPKLAKEYLTNDVALERAIAERIL